MAISTPVSQVDVLIVGAGPGKQRLFFPIILYIEG